MLDRERSETLPFYSILFDRPESRIGLDDAAEPAFFGDLHLDQMLTSTLAGHEDYDLMPFFYTPLHDVAAVRYRHAVLRDLEKSEVLQSIQAFAQQMRRMRAHLTQAEKSNYALEKKRWFLDAVGIYSAAVRSLSDQLTLVGVGSPGLRAFREYLDGYTASSSFTSLAAETQALQEDLAAVRYTVQISGGRVTVDSYSGEADYSAEVNETFAKFREEAAGGELVKLREAVEMNHVEARILDIVARLYADIFSAVDDYCIRRRDYLDETIGAFDREVHFYLAYVEYVERFTAVGLSFGYPQVSTRSKEIAVEGAFDIALAEKLLSERMDVVCNDFRLEGVERLLVVSGPNQGGKTTFARMFGQLHYLGSLGLPVPASRAKLFLPDGIFTHFQKAEDISTLRSKLEDELERIHDILQVATGASLIIMNEIFTATTLSDALSLGSAVLKQIVDVGALGVCVTFVDELATLSESTVSMVSTVEPDDPAKRTYRIVRRPADGLAYAWAIAEKYGLTYERLKERIVS